MANNESNLSAFLSPREAWEELISYRANYYRKYAAPYEGSHGELAATSDPGMFWRRPGKCKVHVPLASDIAATSSDLLFSEEPSFTCFDEATEDNESAQQKRLDELVSRNNIHGKLNEAAESCAVLGDVFLKLNWWEKKLDYPVMTVVQGDSAWAEYVLGILQCIHFFSVVKRDYRKNVVIRAYERYEKGRIIMHLFKGSDSDLGSELGEETLTELGFAPEIKAPVDELLAVHIPNMKPNRQCRDGDLGRSDFDGLRNLMDSLDEVYSSWMRDIRLAKARLIVPAEYLRRKPADMFGDDNRFTYEFDEDVETLVALDIDPDRAGSSPITPSQFAIRAADHAATCQDIMRNIVTIAGYAPQSFGLNIEGMAQSGTALHIREKKSYNTRGKKQTYWKAPLEQIMSALVHLDAALYRGKGSDADDSVKVRFADSMSNDISTMSSALQMLNAAAAISTELKVQMLHPDWTKKQIDEEVQRVSQEYGVGTPGAETMIGDYHEGENEPEDETQELESGGEE